MTGHKDKKPNAWKRYGAIAMAGGGTASEHLQYPGVIIRPPCRRRRLIDTDHVCSMADDASSDAGRCAASGGTETEAETEKRVTLNVAGGEKDRCFCRGSDGCRDRAGCGSRDR